MTALVCYGQDLPPLVNFTPDDYMGDNQNWMVSQAPNDFIYVANNKGLLEFNGSEWVSYASPNNTIIRAVNVIRDKIYTGCYAELGYWKKNQYGTLDYTSLTSKINDEVLKNEQIWNIIDYNEWVVFQSNSAIYFYNTDTENFKTIKASNIIYKIFKANQQIYYHVAEEGLYHIKEGRPNLLVNNTTLNSERIINIFQRGKSLLILTRNSGFYSYENDKLLPWKIVGDGILSDVNIFSGIELEDRSFIIGTISNGIIHLTSKGGFKYQITQKTGLGNNTILSLFEDDANNVWAGLDNGVDCINTTSPIKTFFDYEGVLGTVYVTKVFGDYLYIGSNQGLFYRKMDANNGPFKFVKGTAGQVWDLYNHEDEYLFCGHHLGTFLVDQGDVTKISDELGAWSFKSIPNKSHQLLQGNYNGLFVLEKLDRVWNIKNKIDGFKNSSRYFEINATNQVWVNHEYKGVFRLELNDSLTRVEDLEMESSLPLGKNSSIVKYKDAILYASKEGVYKYKEPDWVFSKDSILSASVGGNSYISGKLVVDENERLWMFSKENISYVENDDITNKPVVNNISIPSNLRKGMLGFENISYTDNGVYVLGTANGYITMDVSEMNLDKEIDYLVYLNSIAMHYIGNDETISCAIDDKGLFNPKEGSLKFKYAVPVYDKYVSIKYQYRLDGHLSKWSKWSEASQISFENLSFGNYTFEVRAKVGNRLSKNIASYNFEIYRPWYLSNITLVLYILLLLIIILFTHKTYNRHYIKKFRREKLQSEQAIMRITNEKLNQDIDNKNRELAISTMSIIKKNKVLNKIKKELKNSDAVNSRAIKLIDNNLNDSKDWSFFEQAFNNADKGFLDKIKKAHPDLTPNDLRFCAYLRLNLSSKEMAPLLNISVKSVETKRYRLRKKLGLEHDNGLVNYILKF